MHLFFPNDNRDLVFAYPAGFSDPVYAEAYVTVHQYDIVLDVTVINRTTETLQNLCLELATMGDLKLVERPQNYTLGPGAQKSVRSLTLTPLDLSCSTRGAYWGSTCACCLHGRGGSRLRMFFLWAGRCSCSSCKCMQMLCVLLRC